MVGKLVIFLACASCVRGDIGDFKCTTSDTHLGKLYCDAKDLADKTLDRFLVSFYCSNLLGWSLVLFYHAVSFARSYALSKPRSESGRPPNSGVRRGRFHRLLQRHSDMDEVARLCRVLGQNLLTYWAYFGATRPDDGAPFKMYANRPFLHSLVFTFIDNIVIWGIRCAAGYIVFDKCGTRTSQEDDAGLEDVKKMWDLKTIYALPGQANIKIALIWSSQTVLFGLYCLVMNESDGLIERRREHVTLTWILGVLVMCTVGEKQSGDSFDPAAWGQVFRVVGMADFESRWWGKVKLRWRLRNVFARFFADWTVNSIYRTVLLNTTPILLCTEGPLDFIKDVLAIAFIATLDDVGDDSDNNEGKQFVRDQIETTGIKKLMRDVKINDDFDSEHGQYGVKAYLRLKVRLVIDKNTYTPEPKEDVKSLWLPNPEDDNSKWSDFFENENTMAAAALWLSTFEQGNRYGCLAFCQDFACFGEGSEPEDDVYHRS